MNGQGHLISLAIGDLPWAGLVGVITEDARGISQAVGDLPWAGLIPVILVLLVGVLLWGAGRRVVRVVLAAAALVVGATVGWVATTGLSLPFPGWAGALGVGLLAALVAALAYRLAVAALLSVLLATAGGLAVRAAGQFSGVPMPDNSIQITPSDADETASEEPEVFDPADGLDGEVADFIRELSEQDERAQAVEAVKEQLEGIGEQVPRDEQTDAAVQEMRDIGTEVYEWASNAWFSAPPRLRLSMSIAAIAGALLGLVLGTIAPHLAASIVTAVGGGLLMLVSGWIIATRLGAPEGPWMPHSPAQWMLWWAGVAVIGLAIQWIFRKRPADKAA